MGKPKLVNIFLVVSGIIAIGIGGALLFIPTVFQASNGINLFNDINLLSEVRAPGGALFAGGVIIILGIFISNLRFTSVVLSSLIYLSYGVSRVLGMIIDGIPNESLVTATIVELVFGLVSVFILIKLNSNNYSEIKKAA